MLQWMSGPSTPAELRYLDEGASLQVVRAKRPSRATGGWAGWLGGALSLVAVLVLLFILYLVGFTRIEAMRSQEHLLAGLNGTNGLPATNGIVPSDGEPVGIISIPAIGLRDVVIAGTSAEDLEQGPAFLLGSAPPGTHGNTVIAGRRISFGGPFSAIGSLRTGDKVGIVSSLGSFTYSVVQVGNAISGANDPVGPIDTARLTLVTANSSVAPTGLEYVLAKLDGTPAAFVARKAILPPGGELGLTGDAGSWWSVLFWGFLLGGAAVLAVHAYRRTKRGLLVYLFGAPVMLALCLLLFRSVAALLPATL
jgi:sortase A